MRTHGADGKVRWKKADAPDRMPCEALPMIEINLSESGILTVKPVAPLEEADFKRLSSIADVWLEDGKELRGLLVDAPSFPGWEDFSGLSAHLRFVRDHHRAIPRIALVTDSAGLSVLPKLARHFVAADVRHFPADERSAAVRWLAEPLPAVPRHLAYSWTPVDKVVLMTVNGKITTGEYQKFLDWFEEILKGQSPVSCVVNLDNFGGVEMAAALADLKFGLKHMKDIRRMALIGNEKWIHRLAALPNPFPVVVRAFDEGHEDDAWQWASA